MKVTCQVISTPTVDITGTVVLLSCEAKKYILGNVGEGIQRAMLQRKVKTSRVSELFITGRTEWRNVGGLLGLILTLADQEAARMADHQLKLKEAIERNRTSERGKGSGGTVPNIPEPFEKRVLTVHGNDNLMHTMGISRSFVFRTSMSINFNEIQDDHVDEFLRVHPMKVFPDGFAQDTIDSIASTSRKRSFNGESKPTREEVLKSVVGDMFNSTWTMDTVMPENEIPPFDDTTIPDPGAPVKMVRAPWPAAMVKSLPRSKPSSASLSYFITLHPQRGRFLPQIAIKIGVKPGPDFRKLTEGQSVTTAEGKLVTPEECMEPAKPGKVILMLDFPSKDYIGPLLSREELQDDDLEATIFWTLGDGVAKDDRIWEKIRKWNKATVGFLASAYCSGMCYLRLMVIYRMWCLLQTSAQIL